MRVFFVILFFLMSTVQAQNTYSVIVVDHDSGEPLEGAAVYFPGLEKGNVTNIDGIALMSNIPDGIFTIEISFLGFEKFSYARAFPLHEKFINEIIELEKGHEEIEEVIIQSTRSSRTIEDIPTRIEFIAGEELSEKGNMKPGDIRMLLNESTGITTQQTSASSYNSSIRIQGLDGKYTLLLRDGLPLYSGYSGGLSLMQITPLDLKQVELIKGSSSTLYGGGAIAGLVNLIGKSPDEEPELSIMLNGTSALGVDLSSFYSAKNENIGTTIFASYNKGTAYDPADIGLTAIPEFDRFTINPKLFLYPSENTEIVTGLNFVTEDRLGGNVDYINGKTVPNPYFERNKTNRVSSQFLLTHEFINEILLNVKNSISYFDRSIQIPNFEFSGAQLSSFTEVTLNWISKNTEWIAGANLWTESFNQSNNLIGLNDDFDFEETTVGAFLQNTWNVTPNWTLESGLRLDDHSEYGTFALPRLSIMLETDNRLTFRLGGGLGYKTPTLFTEDSERIQFNNLVPLNTDLNAERSYGLNFDVNRSFVISDELSLSANILFFVTHIDDPLRLYSSRGTFDFQFYQFGGYVETQGMEVNLKWSYDRLKLFIGYTFSDVQEREFGQTSTFPLVAKNRLNNVLMYEKHGEFWIGLEAYYYSPQTLSDGSIGDSYWITGLMTERVLGKGFSLFLNFENFLDTRQSDFDTIFNGDISNPQFRDIYAPVDGFVINGGFKWKK